MSGRVAPIFSMNVDHPVVLPCANMDVPAGPVWAPEPVVDARSDLDAEEVDDLVRELNAAWKRSRLESVVRIGDLLVQRAYAGSAIRARRERRRNKAFAALAVHPKLKLRGGFLWLAVRVALLVHELPDAVAFGLTLAHHKVLLAVADPEERATLAGAAYTEGWSKRELQARIEAGRARGEVSSPSTLGRPRAAPILAMLDPLERLAALAENPPKRLRPLAAAERHAAIRRAEKAMWAIEEYLDGLRGEEGGA